MSFSAQKVNKIINESLKQTYTGVKKSWSEMMEELSSHIGYDVTLDDAKNYNVNNCEPHHVSIRPIIHDIMDVETFKDGVDRNKKLYLKFDDAKKYIKEFLISKEMNYVDNDFSRNVENSIDKEATKKEQKAEGENVVDPEKDNKPAKEIKMDSMNKEVDDPTQPMRPIGDFKKMVDYPSKKPDYTPPKLPKNLQKLVIKYSKKGKVKK